ncbi:hypothetical protein HKBW3S06_00014 [Candidatus Hakubella thermalkaliphila]|uniref:DUF8076 domain-containing protein n=1 Tax=Candidatus Hakubella thermalkaliphila TaxID=2754717 RepID=A0A6V8P1T4_9ACTN|nr:hypothetical protein [Candidatus Hakubella thermalkaliphila]GFP20787.1 hypothetical protein HKBW3S06_00014 [Candidatus Hakubella thermalkaliphila]GFP24746.1 hypothetical protein HKBW3S25_00183 [Candidatus Hakubella thermalkaliphila]
MPGYRLVEVGNLSPGKDHGIPPYENDIGFLDFLREIAQEPFPFPKFYKVQVHGLEEVLFAARPQQKEIALKIHRILRQAAQNLEKRLVEVQIVFQGKLVKGETLWVEYRNTRLPIDNIFGSPLRQSDARGNPFYRTNFNLTNG